MTLKSCEIWECRWSSCKRTQKRKWSSWIEQKNTNIASLCVKNLSLHDMKYGNNYTYQISVCYNLKNLSSFNDEACEWQVEEPQRLHVQERTNLHIQLIITMCNKILHVQLTITMCHEIVYVKSNQVHCKRHEILSHVNLKTWHSLSLMKNAWHQIILHVNESLPKATSLMLEHLSPLHLSFFFILILLWSLFLFLTSHLFHPSCNLLFTFFVNRWHMPILYLLMARCHAYNTIIFLIKCGKAKREWFVQGVILYGLLRIWII